MAALIWVDYQESIIPEKGEELTEGVRFFDAVIPFLAEYKEGIQKDIEKAVGIKEIEYTFVLVVPYRKAATIKFKKRDRVFVFGKEYLIQEAKDYIPDKFKMRCSKNKALLERYLEYILFLK